MWGTTCLASATLHGGVSLARTRIGCPLLLSTRLSDAVIKTVNLAPHGNKSSESHSLGHNSRRFSTHVSNIGSRLGREGHRALVL